MSQGADVYSSGNNISDTLGYLLWRGTLGGYSEKLLPYLRVVLPHVPDLIYDTEEEVLEGVFNEFHGTAEEFLFMQRECCPSFYSMSQRTRLAVATEAASGYWDAYHMPETIRTIIGPGPLKAEVIQLQNWVGYDTKETTLMHCVSRKMGYSLATMQRQEYIFAFHGTSSWTTDSYKKLETNYAGWNSLLRDIMLTGIDIHHVVHGQTPFLSLLIGYLYRLKNDRFCSMGWKTGFRAWLKDLQANGIDLQQFGENEERIWKKEFSEAEREYFAPESLSLGNNEWPRPLVGFNYGPSPDNWNIWVSEKSDHFAGTFWEMIEMEPEEMPGAWPVE